MMVEFAIIIIINQKKEAGDHDSAKKKENENKEEIHLRLVTPKIAPSSPLNGSELQTEEINRGNENQNKWIDGIRKYISGISVAHAIDSMALWLFVVIFVWFNIDQLLPLLN